jgi:beta-glucosidase
MNAEESRIESLLAQMTLDEQASMSAGSGLWYSTAVPRLGIPAFKMSDGPNGVRGDSRIRGITSACYPVGTAMGATWNRTLLGAVGEALAAECRAKDVDVLLGPTINLHRSPHAGRNFECYSEDPYLSAELAVALIQRVQAGGVACCPKHFVCNDSEFERYSISSNVDARTLRELYLYPFEAVVTRANAWSLMSAHNKVNGVFASANERCCRRYSRRSGASTASSSRIGAARIRPSSRLARGSISRCPDRPDIWARGSPKQCAPVRSRPRP